MLLEGALNIFGVACILLFETPHHTTVFIVFSVSLFFSPSPLSSYFSAILLSGFSSYHILPHVSLWLHSYLSFFLFQTVSRHDHPRSWPPLPKPKPPLSLNLSQLRSDDDHLLLEKY